MSTKVNPSLTWHERCIDVLFEGFECMEDEPLAVSTSCKACSLSVLTLIAPALAIDPRIQIACHCTVKCGFDIEAWIPMGRGVNLEVCLQATILIVANGRYDSGARPAWDHAILSPTANKDQFEHEMANVCDWLTEDA